jgi:hypothetical protein
MKSGAFCMGDLFKVNCMFCGKLTGSQEFEKSIIVIYSHVEAYSHIHE